MKSTKKITVSFLGGGTERAVEASKWTVEQQSVEYMKFS